MINFNNSDIIPLLDLTSLNHNDNDKSITELCKLATNPLGEVASICIYPTFISLAKKYLPTNVLITTVINFPQGTNNISDTLKELEKAINLGADEIDFVIPYVEILNKNYSSVESFVKEVRNKSNKKVLKAIIESGELKTELAIREASKISIDCGVNFIKTSTGKVKVNATLQAAQYMIEEIKKSGSLCGFKAAGGIKTKEEALKYLEIACKIINKDFIDKKTFRLGASSLINNLLGINKQSNY